MTFTRTWQLMVLGVILFILLFGGGASREGHALHLVVHGVSWASLGLLVILRHDDFWASMPKTPLVLFLILAVWVGLTLIPLPVNWAGSDAISQSLLGERAALGLPSTGLAVSKAPAETLRGLLAFGTPLFAILTLALATRKQRQYALGAVVIAGIVSALVGALQIIGGAESIFYYWSLAPRGFFVGVFANPNHQSSFSAITICCVFYFINQNKKRFSSSDKGFGLLAGLVIILALLSYAVLAPRSMAGYIMIVFVLVLNGLVLVFDKNKQGEDKRSWLVAAFPILGLCAGVTFSLSSTRLGNFGVVAGPDIDASRLNVWQNSKDMWLENFYTGTGLGSFEKAYPLFENPDSVTNTFMNHAHNDWLEWVLELGLPGLLLLLAFCIWIAYAAFRMFMQTKFATGQRMARISAIAVMVPAIHSLVDYPLRTPLYALIFAIMLGLLVTKPYLETQKPTENEPKAKQKTL